MPALTGRRTELEFSRQGVKGIMNAARSELIKLPWWNSGTFHPAADRTAMKALLAKDPNDLSARYDAALLALEAGEFDDAEAVLSDANTRSNPYFADLAGRLASARGDPGLVASYPLRWGWTHHAQMLLGAGREDEAFAVLTKNAADGEEVPPPVFEAARKMIYASRDPAARLGEVIAIAKKARVIDYGAHYRLAKLIELAPAEEPVAPVIRQAMNAQLLSVIRAELVLDEISTPEVAAVLDPLVARFTEEDGLTVEDREFIVKVAERASLLRKNANPDALVRLAGALRRAGESSRAAENVERALALSPAHLAALKLKAELAK